MSIFGSLSKLVLAIIRKVFNVFKKLFKVLLPILIVVAVVYFGAPYLSSFFTSINAPAWLTSAISSLPSSISSGLSYLWDKASLVFDTVKELAGQAWKWYKDLDIGTQAMIGLGVSYALAPEETLQLVEDVAEGIGDLAGGVVSAALGGGIGSWLLILLGIYVVTKSSGSGGKITIQGGQDGIQQV